MQKKPVKKYKMEDLMEIADYGYPDTSIFVPKEYYRITGGSTPDTMKEPCKKNQQLLMGRWKSHAKKTSEKGLTKKKEEK